jgi:hypothetical protein
VESNPLDRGHKDNLTAFKQEIRVILKTLQQQRDILCYADRIVNASRPAEISARTGHDLAPPHLIPQHPSYAERGYHSHSRLRSYSREQGYRASPHVRRLQISGSEIDPTDPSGIQGLLTQDSYALIDRKMRLFEELGIRAEEIEEEVSTSVSVLPLSTSPIKSMNAQ